MARSDLLINLFKAETAGDRPSFSRAAEAIIAEERAKKHHVLADRLSTALKSNGNGGVNGVTSEKKVNLSSNVGNLVADVSPERSFQQLILPSDVEQAARELVEEQRRVELLRAHNLEPRHRILLAGPPGNGKTSFAEALANELMYPLLVVRYEGVIGSYLGETTQRLHSLMDFARTRRCVLFFDEFDTVGKERGDEHDSGEIKRVVSTLLLQLDDLPSHVVLVTASNHPELLDRAVWRRFELRLELPMPTRAARERWFESLEKSFEESIGFKPRTLADKTSGLCFAELEQFALDVRRQYVLGLPDAKVSKIVKDRLNQYKARFSPRNARRG